MHRGGAWRCIRQRRAKADHTYAAEKHLFCFLLRQEAFLILSVQDGAYQFVCPSICFAVVADKRAATVDQLVVELWMA